MKTLEITKKMNELVSLSLDKELEHVYPCPT